MDYFELNKYMKNLFDIRKGIIDLAEVSGSIHNYPFQSDRFIDHSSYLSGCDNYIESKLEKEAFFTSEDEDIEENNNFNYIIIKDRSTVKAKEVIFMFHGLNERFWQKYLPWALTLHKLTGKTVVLFPIAFHMNRAPMIWSNPRIMKQISNYRINNLIGINNSTFANAALSSRLHHNPSRFFTSGFRTFYDIKKLMAEIRAGQHNLILDDAQIDFFGYSIGALLAEVLLMSNPNNYFDRSKLFVFCGGPTFDIMFPVAKAILDSEAYNSTRKFFRLFDDYLNICKIDRSSLPEIKYFESLLSQLGLKSVREERLWELKDNIFAVSLIKDKVVPPDSVIITLNGSNKKIPIRTMITDFPYNYSHETPFPAEEGLREIVNINFENIFELASSYLG